MEILIRYIDETGKEGVASLAETIANLSNNRVANFPALRAHQRQPWHCFLVQLATLALQAARRDSLTIEAADWWELLRALTPDFPDDEPWKLVVDDWSKPAFMQPPGMPELARTKGKRALTPDGIDTLLTGRNHDVKGSRIANAQIDDWLFALITLQTSEGQMGAGNFGISRMNGGYGSRVFMGVRSHPVTPGSAFVRDVKVLLNNSIKSQNSQRTGLLWLEPWDGKTQLSPKTLAPLYIDVCRKVRLCGDANTLGHAVLESSKVARVSAKALKGITGDPWAPVLSDRSSSWGISVAGFGYRQVTKLLDPAVVDLPILGKPHPIDGNSGVVVHVSGLTRGQGKTEGFHERVIPVPAAAAKPFASKAGRDRIAEVAEARMNASTEAQKIVRHALMSLYQGGPEHPKLDDDASAARSRVPLRALDDMIDDCFFDDTFWTEAISEHVGDEQSENYAKQWRTRLHELGRIALQVAAQSMPRSSMKQWQAMARSKALLERRMRRFVNPDIQFAENSAQTSA